MKKSVLFIAGFLFTMMFACRKQNSTPETTVTRPQREINLHQYAVMALDSPFISVDTANVMINSYLNSIENDNQQVKSFIVDGDALRYYLQNPQIKHVKLILAHKLNYVRTGGKDRYAEMDHNAMTMVIAGFGSDNEYIYSPQGAVLDFAIPCPSSCPTVDQLH